MEMQRMEYQQHIRFGRSGVEAGAHYTFGAVAACVGLAPVSDQPDIANSGPSCYDNYIPSLLPLLH
jgi:hypothetical protein